MSLLQKDISITSIPLSSLSEFENLHRLCFAGTLGVAMGKHYVHAFLSWFLQEQSAIKLGAWYDRRLVGYAIGAPEGYSLQMNKDLRSIMIRAALTHPWLVLRPGFLRQIPSRSKLLLPSWLMKQTSNPKHPDQAILRLVGIGVLPNFRNLGIGQQLITAYETHAWEYGYSEIRLTVYKTNTSARTLYEANGWTLHDEGKKVSVVYGKKANE